MKKKKFTIAIVLVLLIGIAVPVFAFTHSDDEWNYGSEANWLPWAWDQQRQYSDFYCSEQNHHATAIIAGKDNEVHTYKVTASAKCWAKAKTNWESNATQWNSYYGHD